MISEQGLKERIHQTAKEKDMPFNICWKHLLFERVLCRIASSDFSSHFIFKGGLLLSYLMKIGRETTDLDFLIKKMEVQKESIEHTFQNICSTPIEDGFVFSLKKIELLAQPHMDYEGFRVSLNAKFGRMLGAYLKMNCSKSFKTTK